MSTRIVPYLSEFANCKQSIKFLNFIKNAKEMINIEV